MLHPRLDTRLEMLGVLWTHPDGDRERDRDLDGLLDPELREGLLLTLRDLPPTLPASLAPATSLKLCILAVAYVASWPTSSLRRRDSYLPNPTCRGCSHEFRENGDWKSRRTWECAENEINGSEMNKSI